LEANFGKIDNINKSAEKDSFPLPNEPKVRRPKDGY